MPASGGPMKELPRLFLLALFGLAACSTAPGPSAAPPLPKQYAVSDFYKNSEFFGASWSPDNQKILVSSNLSGIFNAYAVPAAGGEPQPLTHSTSDDTSFSSPRTSATPDTSISTSTRPRRSHGRSSTGTRVDSSSARFRATNAPWRWPRSRRRRMRTSSCTT